MKVILLICCFLSLSQSNGENHDEVIEDKREFESELFRVPREIHRKKESSSSSSWSESTSKEEHHKKSESHEHHKKSGTSRRECSDTVCRTVTWDTSSCASCCVADHLEDYGNHADTSEVTGFIAVDRKKNKDDRRCVCCSPKKQHHNCRPNLTPLKPSELNEYVQSYDNTTEPGKFGAAGIIKYLSTSNGFIATCQCNPLKKPLSLCALEFDNGIETFISHNSTAWNEPSNKDGSFALLSSTLITCDKNGLNIVMGTVSTHIACYSGYLTGNCTIAPSGDNFVCS